MKPNINVVVKTATKELVDSLLAMNTANRKIKPAVVKMYHQDICDNRWMITNQGIGVDINNVLVDGQHRLQAIKMAGYPAVPILIVYGLDPECRNVVDTHSKRTTRDMWKLVLDLNCAKNAPGVCRVIYKNETGWGNSHAPSSFQLKDILDEYLSEITMILQIPTNKAFFACSHYAAFVVAAKQNHSDSDHQKIKEFMIKTESGENLTRDMPEFHFRNFVINSRGNGGTDIMRERFGKALKSINASINNQGFGVLKLGKNEI
jgi:hypothetical protein